MKLTPDSQPAGDSDSPNEQEQSQCPLHTPARATAGHERSLKLTVFPPLPAAAASCRTSPAPALPDQTAPVPPLLRVADMRRFSTARSWVCQRVMMGFVTRLVFIVMLCAPALAQLDLNRLDGDTVCPTMRNGQDDLPGFDLITQFQLDVIPMKGVRKVEGSTSTQVAYRLDREANFQIPTRLNFPRGFPEEYSFMTTFRMIKNTVNKVWNLWQVVDEDGLKQAGMRLNGDQQALEFFLTTMDGDLQTVTFPGLSVLFNTKWHKVMIGVESELVTLYVDCQPVDQKPIKSKGYVSTEGDTLIGRLDTDPNVSVVVHTSTTHAATHTIMNTTINTTIITTMNTTLNTNLKSTMVTFINTSFNTMINSAINTSMNTMMNSAINTSMNTMTNSAINTSMNTMMNSAINTMINSAINTSMNTMMNSAINTSMNTMMNSAINTSMNTMMNSAINTSMNTMMNSAINTSMNTMTNSAINTSMNTMMNSAINTTMNTMMNSAINTSMNTMMNSAINTSMNTMMNSAINTSMNTMMNSAINTSMNTMMNSAINTTMNTMMNSAINTSIPWSPLLTP
ncbi:hypothetical protein NFI96_022260 [Prochilodus magdalenae]|nr:hypothetical protein NFI96_022260 [Prochilodus magdalenae]